MKTSDVYQGSTLAATLERTKAGSNLEFVTDARLEGNRLSVHLARSPQPQEHAGLPAFFLNLLPEGVRLQLLLANLRNRDDPFELLHKVGWDAVGDVAVVPHAEPLPNKPNTPVIQDWRDVDFWELFRRSVADVPDSAIPGAQEKISSGTITFPIRSRMGAAQILKLNPPSFPLMVQNEHFFMQMASACGLEVAASEIVEDGAGNYGLLVRRFDRVTERRKVRKLHQEDMCQLLDIPPGAKYDATMKQAAEVIRDLCAAPELEVFRLVRLYAFSCLIGNGDLHAKNISLLWDGACRLSPSYDLLSTLPYRVDQKMALKMDGRDDNFRARNFVEFAGRYGVPEKAVNAMIAELCATVKSWLPRVEEIGFSSKETERIRDGIGRRIADLLR